MVAESIDPGRAARALAGVLEPRLSPESREWLASQRASCAREAGVLGKAFPAVARRVGRHPLLEAHPAPRRLFPDGGPILGPWSVDDAGRALLLLDDVGRDLEDCGARALARYFEGDARERISVLRALQLLPIGDEGLEAVRDALRANAVDLFAAAICENLYTAAHLPDDLFRQAVLKAVFVGLSLGRIERIEERADVELSRMLLAYVTEREAAGRPVPADLWPVLALNPPPGAAERIRARLATASAEDKPLLEVALGRAQR